MCYKRRGFEDDVFAFWARSDNLAFRVSEVLVYGDFATIISALEDFGKRTTGPPRGTTVAGWDAFGVEVYADSMSGSGPGIPSRRGNKLRLGPARSQSVFPLRSMRTHKAASHRKSAYLA
jgi:hypothetical protein